jgi:S-adenosylmethionine:tRNA ribosyltransferase-isomerase
MTTLRAGLEFQLPAELEAHEPPEARGLARDAVRLMVSRVSDDLITHTRFFNLSEFLEPGDVLVVNTSATINAALPVARAGSASDTALHLSTPLSDQLWVVELRRNSPNGSAPLLDAKAGERLRLPAGGTAQLVEPYEPDGPNVRDLSTGRVRLWVASLTLPEDVVPYTARHGSPIRYGYVPKSWELSFYQTVFANEPGSAEMPSAGRAFTYNLLVRLAGKGVCIAPIVLHAGVSSLEEDESPFPERYRVPAATADAINHARALGGRIIAVGTTAVRALETVASNDGFVKAGHGWTDLVISPDRGLRTVDAILTGFHAPNATHLSLLEALAGRDHIALAYEAALRERYLWHEFGDLHLILP